MDLKVIQGLVALMKRGGVGELEVEDQKNGFKVRLKRTIDAPAAPMVQVVQGGAALPVAAAAPLAAPPAAAPVAAQPEAKPEVAGKPVPSPMIGTFYRSASPEAEPFVSVGSRVTTDSVLCIIEAMKVMNEIKSEVSGEVVAILVENGEPVEFGQPLFLVKSA